MTAAFLLLATPARPDPADPDLAYRFHLVMNPELAVEVDVAFTGAPAGSTELHVAREWGGVTNGGEDIFDLTVRDGRGEPLAVEHPEPNVWRVQHDPGEPLTAAYRLLPNAYQTDPDPGVNRRPILNDHLLHFLGEQVLVRPVYLEDEAPHAVSLAWNGFEEAGWKVATSFGIGSGPHAAAVRLGQLTEAVYLAGEARILVRTVKGYPVYTAIAGTDWEFTDDAFADLVAHVVELERGFFEDYDHPYYLVTVIPVGVASPGSWSLGGTGLTDSFAIAMLPGSGLGEGSGGRIGVPGLLAHEMFHDWNGHTIRNADPEELVYWFSEGFTNFYARRLMVRGGLMDVDGYAASVNRALAGLYTSAVRDAPNERIREDFWNDPEVKNLPYLRGDVIAMVLDHAIRNASSGKRSLDDFMRSLVEAGRRGERVSTESLLADVAEAAGPGTAEQIRAIVEDGALPELDAATFAPCLEMTTEMVEGFELGFDYERSTKERAVRGLVPGSAAEKAGLVEGQALAGWSIHFGDAAAPVTLTVRTEDGKAKLTYLPASEPRPVPQFRPRWSRPGSGEDAKPCPAL